MSNANTLRSVLTELVTVFIGVALAFAVENLRQDFNDRTVGDQYLSSFRRDLMDDLVMLQTGPLPGRTTIAANSRRLSPKSF